MNPEKILRAPYRDIRATSVAYKSIRASGQAPVEKGNKRCIGATPGAAGEFQNRAVNFVRCRSRQPDKVAAERAHVAAKTDSVGGCFSTIL
jgi:hypothetical protein